jgi:hypothetical protein
MPSTVPKMLAAALLAGMLALPVAPAYSAETSTPDDTARFLAGLQPAPDSPLAALAKSPAWEQHERFFNSIFGREDTNTLSKVRAFAAARLTETHSTMLYMFSGPDFLYATSFFPHASTYVLSGLEPVGDIPQLAELSRGSVDETLHHLERSLYTILNLSFFITKNMQTQLSEGPVFGTLPILYVFLARTGKTVHEASFVRIDGEGNFIPPDEPASTGAGKHSAVENATSGVKIVFSDGNGPMQTLYYFSTDLGDDGVKRSGFLAFCDKFGTADSLVKSASYLLHNGGFAKVRGFLLDHSATILQDDSGIPAAYFDAKKWQLQPFGRYLGPISIFTGDYQPRLAELFRRDAVPLDFGIGYRWQRNESNLLLAEKIAPDVTQAIVNPPLTAPADGVPGVPVGSPNPPAWTRAHPRVASASKPPSRSAASSGFLGLFRSGDNNSGTYYPNGGTYYPNGGTY